jgi:hypothetical protein
MHSLGRGRGRGAAGGGRHLRRFLRHPINGQGHATAYAQFVAEHLDVPVDRVLVVQGDTGRVATGHGTVGSRSIPIGGVSVAAASQELSRKLKELASDALEAAPADLEIADGAVRVIGTDRQIVFPELARLPKAVEEARTGVGTFTPPDATYPNGTHIAESGRGRRQGACTERLCDRPRVRACRGARGLDEGDLDRTIGIWKQVLAEYPADVLAFR